MSKSTFQQKELREIAEISSGNSAPQGLEHFAPIGYGTPFVRMQDLGRYGKTPNLTEVVDYLEEATSKKLKIFPSGSILIPKSGASIRLNHRAILGVDAHVVSHLAIIQAKPSYVLNKYLYYWLHTIDFSNKAHDADLPSLKLSDLANLQVPVPSLETQEEIVSILEEIDALRQKQRNAIELTRQMIPALFYAMFGDPVSNDKKINKGILKHFTLSIKSGFACGKSSRDASGNILHLRPMNITSSGKLSLLDTKFIPIKDLSDTESFAIKKDDVLFNNTNSKELVGKSCYVSHNLENTAFSNHITRIRTKPALDPFFLSIQLQAFQEKGLFLSLCNKWIGQAGINNQKLSDLSILVPPIELQKVFTQKARECLLLLENQEHSLQKLDILFEAILTQFFS